ncbi:pregnancy-associated plasma protein-A domain containing protein [Nitzschia inconspicua]|uniref:Pregnancy-associated plasma protein-A domain containing protein n=1 Tax=Nitzschia inconspicua TaxID=303405 RepID=A0A9K3LWY2_9STRA|nr:pregnancy-associated plasma protein-A domain containing protein [Nitzschia inconspicua]
MVPVRRHVSLETTTSLWALVVVLLMTILAPLGVDAIQVGQCGTKTPSHTHQRLDQARMRSLKERTVRTTKHNRKLLWETCQELAQTCNQCVNIPIYVHFLTIPDPDSESGSILPHPEDAFRDYLRGTKTASESDFTTPTTMFSMVQENVNLVNRVYQHTPFRFTLTDDYTVTPNRNWTLNGYENQIDIAKELGQGGLESMNIYLFPSLDVEGGSVYGFAPYASFQGRGVGDGVWIDYSTITGGGKLHNDLGYTLAHEIGHWFGLYHTFENSREDGGDPCSDTNKNDWVDDTGHQAAATSEQFNCTDFLVDGVELPNTCPDQPLRDPFFNIMNYLDNEDCYSAADITESLTCGQIERMWMQWNLYREAANACHEDEMLVDINFAFDSQFWWETTFQLSTVGSVDTIFDSVSDFDAKGAAFFNHTSVDMYLCLPRAEEYEFVVQDSFGDGSSVNPASITVNENLTCTVPADFGFEARIRFTESSLKCDGNLPTTGRSPVSTSSTSSFAMPFSSWSGIGCLSTTFVTTVLFLWGSVGH